MTRAEVRAYVDELEQSIIAARRAAKALRLALDVGSDSKELFDRDVALTESCRMVWEQAGQLVRDQLRHVQPR